MEWKPSAGTVCCRFTDEPAASATASFDNALYKAGNLFTYRCGWDGIFFHIDLRAEWIALFCCIFYTLAKATYKFTVAIYCCLLKLAITQRCSVRQWLEICTLSCIIGRSVVGSSGSISRMIEHKQRVQHKFIGWIVMEIMWMQIIWAIYRYFD